MDPYDTDANITPLNLRGGNAAQFAWERDMAAWRCRPLNQLESR